MSTTALPLAGASKVTDRAAVIPDRTVYILNMCDHSRAVAGAMHHEGVDAEVLPLPDDQTLELGKDHCRGSECLPCLMTTGDMLRKCMEPGFDPSKAAFFMPTGTGPCRFSQYSVLQRDVLAEAGYGDAVVMTTTGDNYGLFGENPERMRRKGWEALVAVDLLQKLLLENRPYEVDSGASEAAYQASLDGVVEAMENGGGKLTVQALEKAAARFQAIELDMSQDRPLIAILGEIYVMLNEPANLNLVRAVERAGGEVLLGTFMDWLYFSDWHRRDQALRFRRLKSFTVAQISDMYQRWIERRLVKPLRDTMRHPTDRPIGHVVDQLKPVYDPELGTEAVLNMTRTIDLAGEGLAGVISVLPFSCLPGMIVCCMGPKIRELIGGLPWLDIAFDGQKETNLNTRLEAFMHQAEQFKLSREMAQEP